MIKLKKILNEWNSQQSEALHKKYDTTNEVNINESKYNSEILDFIQSGHTLFNKLKKDKNINKKTLKNLFTDFGPVVGSLHSLVNTNEYNEKSKN